MLRIKSTIYLTGQANLNDRNSKFQTKKLELKMFGHWNLWLGIYLKFGACNLLFPVYPGVRADKNLN